MVGFVYIELSTISTFSVEGPALDPEPSAIHALSVDGSALDPEPSMKSTSTADGSLPDTRTIRDSGPQHGRFRFGCVSSSPA